MKKIVIDCECNNIANIKCGGEHVLGFEFYTDKDGTIKLIDEVKGLLAKYSRPLMQIYCEELQNTGYVVSTLDFIETSIKEGY